MSNNNNDNKLLSQLLTSDFAKSLVVIMISLISFTWSLSNAKNDLKESITAMSTELKLTNVILENRIEKLEIKQQNDIDNIRRK